MLRLCVTTWVIVQNSKEDSHSLLLICRERAKTLIYRRHRKTNTSGNWSTSVGVLLLRLPPLVICKSRWLSFSISVLR
jgi:hypothetical protein